MRELAPRVVEAFCSHCDWAHQTWLLRKHIFDENPHLGKLEGSQSAFFFRCLAKVLQEYWMNEVAKVGDRRQRDTLSVGHIFEGHDWSAETKAELRTLKATIDAFTGKIKDARNHLLSHKRVQTIIDGVQLGEYEAGEDEEYFRSLLSFAGLVHEQVIGKPFDFDSQTESDVRTFLSTFERGLAS